MHVIHVHVNRGEAFEKCTTISSVLVDLPFNF